MKTKEFIRKIKDLGFEIEKGFSEYIITSQFDTWVAQVSRREICRINNNYTEWGLLNDSFKKDVFDIIFEYASTPLDERKEEKKCFYEHKFIKTRGGNPTYLAIRQRPNNKYPILQGSCKDVFEYKIEFTDKEIKEAKKQYGIFLDDFVKKEIVEE